MALVIILCLFSLMGASRSARAQAPAIPTGLAVSGGTNLLTLSWTNVAGLTYDVYRYSNTSPESSTPTYTGVSSPFSDATGVVNGTQYYYKITAVDASSVQSAKSGYVSAVPVAQPTGVTARADNGSITLSWPAATGAQRYRIYRGMAPGSETPLATDVSTLTYTDSGLTNGTTYYYKVSGSYADPVIYISPTESTLSAEVFATPAAALLIAPAGLDAVPGNNKVIVSWSAVSGATSYNLYRSLNRSGGPYTLLTSPTATGYTDTTAVNGTTTNLRSYYYVVTAVNAAGESGYSNEAVATPASAAVGTTLLSIADTTASSDYPTVVYGYHTQMYAYTAASATRIAYIKFDLSGVGSAIAGAGLRISSSSLGSANSVTASGVADTSWTEGGLVWGNHPALGSPIVSANIGTTQQWITWDVTSYIAAQQALGQTQVTLALTMDTTATLTDNFLTRESGIGGTPQLVLATAGPLAAANLTATAGTNQITLSWNRVPGATSYSVYRSGSANTEASPALVTGLTSPGYINTPLSPGSYFYKVSAFNANGESAWSNEATATVVAPPTITNFTPPSGPVGTSVTITGTNFTGATSVKFNTTSATTFTVVNATSITATVPTGATTGLISVTTPGGTAQSATNFTVGVSAGNPAPDVPAPGWAPDVVPVNTSDSPGSGPSSSDGVDLASGVKENKPNPDITVYNPVGPGVRYTREYRSAIAETGYNSPGLSSGWVDNFDLKVIPSGSNYKLSYPSGGSETWIAAGAGAFNAPVGAPYTISSSAGNFLLNFNDNSSQTFAPDPNVAGAYLLSQLTDPAGNSITLYRDSTNGNRINTIRNNAGTTLLTFTYTGSALSTLTDVYNRVITFGFTSGALTTVSQINSAASPLWQYGYLLQNSHLYLNSAITANPAGTGLSNAATTMFDVNGHVARLTDANGNYRTYQYSGTSTVVSCYSATDQLTQQWTQKFDAQNRDVGVVDSASHSTTLVYGDINNPYKVTSATNRNGQTSTATFGASGQIRDIANLRSVHTAYVYDPIYHGLPAQMTTTGKTPVKYTYYSGNTVVGGVAQPNGFVSTSSVPTPGTINTNTWVTTTYVYTALGSIASVTRPAPNTTVGATVTATNNYTTDNVYDVNGNPGTYTALELLGKPLTVSTPLGLTTHLRYDTQGRVVIKISPLGFRKDYQYNAAGQVTQITEPATNPATPTARAYTVYQYFYLGGPLQTITKYDESRAVVRQSSFQNGNEGEGKLQTGEVQDLAFAYDSRYRGKTLTDGNNNAAKNVTYDSLGNVANLLYALGDGPQFTQYDADGNLSHAKNARNTDISLTLASDDSRVTDIMYSDGTPAVHFGTNGNGYDVYDRAIQVSTSVAGTSYTYDDNDNVLSQTVAYGTLKPATISYTYNNDGSRATMTTPKALSGSFYTTWTYAYTYDNDGRLVDIQCPWIVNSRSSAFAHVKYYYDDNNRLVKCFTNPNSTCYVYNARNFLIKQESSLSAFYSVQFTDPDGTPSGTIPNFHVTTNSGQTAVVGTSGRPLLTSYQISYDALGNRLKTDVYLPALYLYDTNSTNIYTNAVSRTTGGSLFYSYDGKDRKTLQSTTNPATSVQTFSDPIGQYNNIFNYTFGFDGANNPTTVFGAAQGFNANNQLTAATYDADGNQTNWTDGNQSGGGATLGYDAENRTTSLNNLVTTLYSGSILLQYNADGQRAIKTAGSTITYSLYDNEGNLTVEMDGSGNVINSFLWGPAGLTERAPPTVTIPYFVYLYDPDGNVTRRTYSDDPYLTQSNGVFAHTTMQWDDYGRLHAYIDALSGGFTYVDMVGYGGQWGRYTDIETYTNPNIGTVAAGTYLSTEGPGGAVYYNPKSGVALARLHADNANEYADAMDRNKGALKGMGSVIAAGVGFELGGLKGSAAAVGVWDYYCDRLDGVGQQEAITHGVVTAGMTYVGGKVIGAVASRLAAKFAPAAEVAGAETENVVASNCFVAGTPVQMSDGNTKPIEKIQVGDQVVSRNPGTGLTETKSVLRIFQRQAEQVLNLELMDTTSRGNVERITCTPGHPFYVRELGFVYAGQLQVGMPIITLSGAVLAVRNIEWCQNADGSKQGTRVYNFTVADDHTYFVGSYDGGVWVHNTSDQLADAMRTKYGIRPPGVVAANPRGNRWRWRPHHIVPETHQLAAAAREILASVGIGVNDAENGIYLPQFDSPQVTGMVTKHTATYSNAYVIKVTEDLETVRGGTRQEVLQKLAEIQTQLANGTYLP